MLKPRIALHRRPPHDERGSLIVVLLVILVLATLAAALLTQVVASDKTAFAAQNHDAAVSAAEAGVSDALFRLDQQTGSSPDFCVLGTGKSTITSTDCPSPLATSVPGAGDVSYLATYDRSTGRYTIRSEAWVNGSEGAVQVTATHTVAYPFAVYGQTKLKFDGTNSFSYYNDAQSQSDDNPASSGTGGTTVAIGTAGQVDCTGGVGSVETVLYTSAASQTNCPDVQAPAGNYAMPSTTAPSGALACPGTGTGGGTIGSSGSTTYLPAGTYSCTTAVTLSGTIDVTGPVKLYIAPPAGTTNALTISGGAEVNIPAAPTLPQASLLQIFSGSSAGFGNYNGAGTFIFGGTIDAPNGNLVGDGCKSTFYGSLVLNTDTCNGAHLSMYYDTSLSSLYSSWRISGYTEIPASDVAP